MHNLKELKIWNKAILLAKEVHSTTKGFPVEERYGLQSQIRRASVSIASNVAEGAGRNSEKEFVHFLSIANGSAYELQTQLILSHELRYITKEKIAGLLQSLEEIQKMNYGLQNRLIKTKSHI